MQTISKTSILTTGLALFAMMFGAGNIVFALAIGQFAQDKTLFAILGLLLSGVVVPFIGLIAMTLFNGDYKSFFDRIGKVPGFILSIVILGLLGPLGVIPRCIALSYATTKASLPDIPLPLFSLACCLFIFAFTFRRNRILDLLGYVLTPLKLGSLAFLIVLGLIYAPAVPSAPHHEITTFLKGFTDGYQTMDLLGSFFICSVVLDGLRRNLKDQTVECKSLIYSVIKSSFIGAGLLALVYTGFSYVAAYHSHQLDGVSPEELVSRIALMVLGPYGGIFICLTVTLACLTTAIAMSSVFANFMHREVSGGKISYPIALTGTMIITFLVSILDFSGIIKMLAPILSLCYPALIVLSLINILYKIYKFEPVKVPVFIAFAATICMYFLT